MWKHLGQSRERMYALNTRRLQAATSHESDGDYHCSERPCYTQEMDQGKKMVKT